MALFSEWRQVINVGACLISRSDVLCQEQR
jgi:hypothetical protein